MGPVSSTSSLLTTSGPLRRDKERQASKLGGSGFSGAAWSRYKACLPASFVVAKTAEVGDGNVSMTSF